MSALFGGAKVKTPEVKAPTPMPDEQDPAVLASKRKALADIQARSGRSSTLLSGASGGSPLGADSGMSGVSDYSSTTLGGSK